MPRFSKRSEDRLATCDPLLIKLFAEVIKHVDCTVICGHRGKAEQDDAFEKGFSKLKYPKSKHNKAPSLAVDVAPILAGKIPWEDREAFVHFAGFVMGVAAALGIAIIWGGDFDQDGNFRNGTLFDGPHFELDLDP